ncbi:hypothetical protein [Kibdelosporangium phytohabitans]|nr:hypothetical protein [Kibdelosporangium phytohabitans]MBE1471193.1 hypothetical protein [Kibdelosporangium phytohabitans]
MNTMGVDIPLATEVLRPVQQATGWEKREEGLSHTGYVIELDVANVG